MKVDFFCPQATEWPATCSAQQAPVSFTDSLCQEGQTRFGFKVLFTISCSITISQMSVWTEFHLTGNHPSNLTPSISLAFSFPSISSPHQQSQTLVLVTTHCCSFSQISSSELPFPNHFPLAPCLPALKPMVTAWPFLSQLPVHLLPIPSHLVSRSACPTWSPS